MQADGLRCYKNVLVAAFELRARRQHGRGTFVRLVGFLCPVD